MVLRIFQIYLVVQFSLLIILNYFIFPAACEIITFQKTKILKENNNYFKNYQNKSQPINELKNLIKGNFIENEQFNKSNWFSNIPLLPIAIATSKSIPDGPCKTQLRLYLNHLKNGTLWAVEMFDSSAKYPYGIFDGLNRYLGSFDQCNRIQTIVSNSKENDKFEEIRSKYCLVEINYQKNHETINNIGKYDLEFESQKSAWELIWKTTNFRTRYQRNVLQMALCFPAKCHTKDIIAALKEPLEKFNSQYNLQVHATIHPEYCHTNNETSKFSNSNRAYCFFLCTIIGLVVISTILDIKSVQQENNYCFSRKLLACFSARRSLNAIFKVKYNQNAFDCLHLIRCIFASSTVFQHRNIELMHGGNITGSHYEKILSTPFLGLIYNTDITVDGFFGLSGIVLSYYLLEFLENSNGLKIFPLIFKRFIRLTPLYMFMAFAYAFFIYHLGSGPFWESRFGYDRDSCSSNWWTNLFFIHNYVNCNKMCIPQSWYLAVDFQCYIIGLLLIGVFHKMPRKIGYYFLGCILIISAAIPFYITYNNNVDPFIKLDLRKKRVEAIEYLTNYYIKTHMRLSAYFVGLIMGIVMYDCKFIVWRLSKFWSHFLFILQVMILPLLFQWFGSYFIDENSNPSLFTLALYACLHRPIFAFSICSILLLITIGQGLDFYYYLLTPRWIQPFSRLSYAIFLSHFAIQSYELGTARTAFTYSFYNSIRNFIGDIIYVSFLSLVLVILIEKPFSNLEKLLFRGKKEETSFNSDKKIE